MLHEGARVSTDVRRTREANLERADFAEVAEWRSVVVGAKPFEAQGNTVMESPSRAVMGKSSGSSALHWYWRTSQVVVPSRSE